jgi:hypothetical protein
MLTSSRQTCNRSTKPTLIHLIFTLLTVDFIYYLIMSPPKRRRTTGIHDVTSQKVVLVKSALQEPQTQSFNSSSAMTGEHR